MRLIPRLLVGAALFTAVPASSLSAQWFSGIDVCLTGWNCYLNQAARVNSTTAFDAWLLSLGGATTATETFSGFGLGTTSPLNLTGYPDGVTGSTDYVGVPGGSGIIANGGTTNPNNVTQTLAYAGLYGVSGPDQSDDRTTDQFFFTNGGFNLTFTGGAPVFGFGFWGIDMGDFGKDFFVRLYDGSNNQIGNQLSYTDTYGSGSVLFAGYTGTKAIKRVEFVFQDNARDGFAFDDMTIGIDSDGTITEVVPEPATMTLLATGLVGLAGAARRRKGKL